MSSLETKQTNRRYLSIAQGAIRESVPEGTPKAIKRDWEAGGKKGTKHELVYDHIIGTITDINFYEGEADGRKFTNINVVFDKNSEGINPVVSVGIKTRYGSDLLKKLPAVNLKEEIKLRPFSFRPDGEDKDVTGVEVLQRHPVSGNFEKKVTSHFHKKNGERWEAINGYPTPEGDTRDYSSDDWDIFYKQANKFLVGYMRANIIPLFENVQEEIKTEEEINPEDIPF